MWIQTSFNSLDFITALSLSHMKDKHQLNCNKQLDDEGYQCIENKKINLGLWFIRDTQKTIGLGNLKVIILMMTCDCYIPYSNPNSNPDPYFMCG